MAITIQKNLLQVSSNLPLQSEPPLNRAANAETYFWETIESFDQETRLQNFSWKRIGIGICQSLAVLAIKIYLIVVGICLLRNLRGLPTPSMRDLLNQPSWVDGMLLIPSIAWALFDTYDAHTRNNHPKFEIIRTEQYDKYIQNLAKPINLSFEDVVNSYRANQENNLFDCNQKMINWKAITTTHEHMKTFIITLIAQIDSNLSDKDRDPGSASLYRLTTSLNKKYKKNDSPQSLLKRYFRGIWYREQMRLYKEHATLKQHLDEQVQKQQLALSESTLHREHLDKLFNDLYTQTEDANDKLLKRWL